MTKENILKLHRHLTFLSKGEFSERDFDKEYQASDPENSGRMTMGKMSSSRVALIVSDAKRHLAALEAKHIDLFTKAAPKPVTKTPSLEVVKPVLGKLVKV